MFSRELNKHETFEKFINESCESQLKGVAWLPSSLLPPLADSSLTPFLQQTLTPIG